MPTLDGKPVTITVAPSKCIACGQCVKVCPSEYLALDGKKVAESTAPAMGCITCAQCAAICPAAAISVETEGLAKEDVFEFSGAKALSYEELLRSFAGRRSIRKFTDAPAAREAVDKLLEAAQQAPAGLPPSTVRCVVIHGKDKVRSFAFDFLDEVAKMGWLFSRVGIWALRPFMSAAYHKEMRAKIAPIYRGLMAERKKGNDYLFYDAPLAMIFLSSGDATDAVIACTYAMAAAETMGLGSCMIGTVTPMLTSAGKAFRAKHQVPDGMKDGLAIIFGVPAVKFRRAVRRRFAGIHRA